MSDTPLQSDTARDSRYSGPEHHLVVSRPAAGVVLVELANPGRRNAMSMTMTAAWQELINELAIDSSVRCVAITGQGTSFCSGGDTGWIGSEPDATIAQLRARMMPFYRTWLAIRQLEVPVLAGINGPAVGAGACLALAADLRVASTAARFSVPFLSLGMHPGMATTFLLPEVIGVAAARDLLFTGRTVAADEMARLGLVSQVWEPSDFERNLVDLATQVASGAPLATRLTKAALRDGGFGSLEDSIRWEALAQPVTLASADLIEGLAAARERRTPQFDLAL